MVDGYESERTASRLLPTWYSTDKDVPSSLKSHRPTGGHEPWYVGDSAASRHDPLAPELGNGPPTLGRSLTSRFFLISRSFSRPLACDNEHTA